MDPLKIVNITLAVGYSLLFVIIVILAWLRYRENRNRQNFELIIRHSKVQRKVGDVFIDERTGKKMQVLSIDAVRKDGSLIIKCATIPKQPL